MVRRACLIVAVFVETSTLVPRHVSDKCFSGAIVFSGWSSCDCKRADPHTVKLPVLVPRSKSLMLTKEGTTNFSPIVCTGMQSARSSDSVLSPAGARTCEANHRGIEGEHWAQ